MSEVEQLYQQCSELSEVVRPIKDVNRRHQQVSVWVWEYTELVIFSFHNTTEPAALCV